MATPALTVDLDTGARTINTDERYTQLPAVREIAEELDGELIARIPLTAINQDLGESATLLVVPDPTTADPPQQFGSKIG